MKKFKSFLALLLLGSLVATGCGGKNNTPSDSGGSQQNNNSGSGDNGGGSQGGSQQGGEGGGQQGGGSQQGGEGGGQQGGGEGGGQQGGGEVPVDSQFVNKKFVFDSLSYPDNPTIESALNANYQNAYASFFQNGKFELISVINTYTMALLGTYTVADDDSYARLDVLKEYDGQHEAYDYVTSGTFVTNLRYNQGLQKYVLPITQYVEDLHGNISFDVYLTLSNDLPEPANLPEDPNGETFDPAYQVYKDVWDRLFVERGLIHASTSNYKVTHDTTIFEVDDGEKFYEHYTTGAPNSGFYWERTSIVGSVYSYNHTIVAGGVVNPASPVEYGSDFFDSSIGLVPVPFNWMTYNSVGHYYYRNSYTYQNSWTGSVTVNNYRVYFGQYYRVLKITYEDNAHQSFEFNFSNYNQVEIDIPDAGGGGGGGGDPENPSSYLANVRNTVFNYNRVSGNYLSDEDKTALGSAYGNSSVAIFNNDSIQFSTSAYYDENDDLVNSSLVLYGTLSFTNAGTEPNGRTYVQGSIAQQYVMIGGTTYTANGTTTVRYYPNNDEFRITQHYDGESYFIYLALTNESPVVIPHGDPQTGGGSAPTQNYLTAKAAFETATGIALPTVNDIDADYYDNDDPVSYVFYTSDGLSSSDLESFITLFETNLDSWTKGTPYPSDNGYCYQYTYTSSEGDELLVEYYYSFQYLVLTYTPHVSGGSGGGGGGQGGGGEGGQGGGGEGGGQQGGGGNIPFNDTVTWESVIGDPPGPEITPEQAETVVNGILTYQASAKVKNARVEEYENGSVINRVEFDTDTLAAYSWSADDNEESFTFVESTTGYYYFTDPDLDDMHPEIQDWYCTYSDIDEYDYDWENEATDFNSRFKGLMTGAYGFANAEIDIDTSVDYSGFGTVTYYSSGVGHIRVVAEIMGYTIVTEWKDYKPLLYGSPDSFTYYSYDVSVKKPESRENYTLYGAF